MEFVSPAYRQAVVRYRAPVGVGSSLVWSDTGGEHEAQFALRHRSDGWAVGVLDLTRLPGWSRPRDVSGIGLRFDHAWGEEILIDVDFVDFLIVAP